MDPDSNEFNSFEYFEDDDMVDDAFGAPTCESVTTPREKKIKTKVDEVGSLRLNRRNN